jgi:serine/threonine-protein kinase SRPK3
MSTSGRSTSQHSTSSAIPFSEEEDVEDYNKGGYHAVKLGDSFAEDRYKIIRKLGWGHFSTVWLSRDLTYVFTPKKTL